MNVAEKTRVAKDGRYEIGIPWKAGEPQFENNYDMAYRRLQNLEKSLMKKGPDVATEYNKIIEDNVNKNYVRKVQLKEEQQWFLPHFPVVKDDRTTTKVRIVYDTAAKEKGKCLNDAILSGPKLQQDLSTSCVTSCVISRYFSDVFASSTQRRRSALSSLLVA